MLERSEGTQHCRRMDEAIEPTELRVNRARDIAEIVGTGFGEIERKDRRLRMARGNDFVVQRFEFSHDAAVQHERCAARSATECKRVTQAAGRAGDQHDALRQIDIECACCGIRKRHPGAAQLDGM